jgi:hypothetical protein
VRAAPPVHPAQVVASVVLADRDVLGTAAGEVAGPVVPGAGPRAEQRDRRERDHLGRDHEGGGRGEGAVHAHQAERVVGADRHRAERVPAAHVAAHDVGHGAVPVRVHLVDHEPRAYAEGVGHLLLEQQQPGRGPSLVAQREPHRRSLTDRDPCRRHRPGQSEPVPSPGREPGSEDGQHHEQHPHPGQVVHVEDERAEDGGRARGDERAAPRRQRAHDLPHQEVRGPSEGIGTASMTDLRTEPASFPAITASTVGSSRCASTGIASTRRSSGTT